MMKLHSLILSILIIISLASNCDDLPTTSPEFQRGISIVGVLDTSQQPQKIYAFYTVRLNEEPVSIQNALVEISSEIQQLQFKIGADTLDTAYQPRLRYYYCDRPETLHVIPEMKYHLRFVTAEGDSLLGETVVPGKFSIIAPIENTIELENSLTILWSKSKSAYGYIINLLNPPTEYPPGSRNFIHRTPSCYQTNDTTYTIYRKYGFKKGNYTIKVMAYDQNYHYHHAEGISSCGVIGGYGVFGSAVIDSVVFTIE